MGCGCCCPGGDGGGSAPIYLAGYVDGLVFFDIPETFYFFPNDAVAYSNVLSSGTYVIGDAARTAQKLVCKIQDVGGGFAPVFIHLTLMVNNVATALAVTFNARLPLLLTDMIDTVPLVQGDMLGIRIQQSGLNSCNWIAWSLELV
jgi:hypothetical protein